MHSLSLAHAHSLLPEERRQLRDELYSFFKPYLPLFALDGQKRFWSMLHARLVEELPGLCRPLPAYLGAPEAVGFVVRQDLVLLDVHLLIERRCTALPELPWASGEQSGHLGGHVLFIADDGTPHLGLTDSGAAYVERGASVLPLSWRVLATAEDMVARFLIFMLFDDVLHAIDPRTPGPMDLRSRDAIGSLKCERL